MRKAILLLSTLLLGFQGTPQWAESITAGTSAISSERRFTGGHAVVSAAAANTVRIQFSKDYLVGGDFEDRTYNAGTKEYLDECTQSSNALNGAAWSVGNDTEMAATCEVDTTLGGWFVFQWNGSVTELVANNGLETQTGDDFDNWTESVNGGTGTILREGTTIHGGADSVKLTGGSAHVDFTSDTITVTANTTYVLAVWGRLGAAGDLLDIRVREATGGTDFLQTNGTWAAGEVDFCATTFVDTGWTQCTIRFTTDTGITGITVSANVDVTGDIGYADDFSLTVQSDEVLYQTTKQTIFNTFSDSYLLCFAHYEDTTSVVGEYAIIDPDIYPDDVALAPQYYTGSAWTTTETWVEITPSTTAATVCAPFEARTGTGNYVQVKFRIRTFGADGDQFHLDAIRLTESITSEGGQFVNTVPQVFQIGEPGRFVVRAASSTVVNFGQTR